MKTLRATFRENPRLLALVLVLALLMKAWVPMGYMPVLAGGTLSLMPCSGHGVLVTPLVSPSHGEHSVAHAHVAGHDAAGPNDTPAPHTDMPCLFAGLSALSLAGTDPLLLVFALALIFLAARRMPPQRLIGQSAHLRPPAQGPPAIC